MTAVDTLQPWGRDLSETLHAAEPIAEDENALRYRISRADRIDLILEVCEDSSRVLLCASILAMPADNRLPWLQTMLEFNLLCQKTAGTTLALDPNGQHVVLGYAHPLAGLDSESFVSLACNFLAIAEHLGHELEEACSSARAPSAEEQHSWMQHDPRFLA